MKQLYFLLLLLFPLLAKAANPAFTQFNTNHFTTNGYIVSAKGVPTNANLTNFFSTNFLGQVTNIVNSQLTNGNLVYVDQRVGSDVLVKRWGFNWPALSPSGAVAIASSGDTVWVRPGNYTNNNLLKNGVNYYVPEGASIVWLDTGTGTNASRGIFDDRHITGGTTNVIWGFGNYLWRSGQDHVANDPRGLFVITQALSQVTFQFRRCDASYTNSIANPSVSGVMGVIHVSNGRTFYIQGDEIVDSFVPYLDGPPEEETTIGGITPGVFWGLGELHLNVKRIATTSYGLWGQEPAAGNHTNNLFYEGDIITSSPGLYVDCHSPNYRTWMKVQECTSWTTYGGGRHYIQAGKITDIDIVASLENWVFAQKLSATEAWIDVANETTNPCVSHISIQHLEDLSGTMAAGIRMASTAGGGITTNGTVLHLNVGYAQITNAPAIVHRAGHLDFSGTWVTRGTATNAWPIYLYGTNGSVIARSPTLIANASTAHSIYASNAQSMKIYGHATSNTNEAPLVTIQTGTFTVNGNVTAP